MRLQRDSARRASQQHETSKACPRSACCRDSLTDTTGTCAQLRDCFAGHAVIVRDERHEQQTRCKVATRTLRAKGICPFDDCGRFRRQRETTRRSPPHLPLAARLTQRRHAPAPNQCPANEARQTQDQACEGSLIKDARDRSRRDSAPPPHPAPSPTHVWIDDRSSQMGCPPRHTTRLVKAAGRSTCVEGRPRGAQENRRGHNYCARTANRCMSAQ